MKDFIEWGVLRKDHTKLVVHYLISIERFRMFGQTKHLIHNQKAKKEVKCTPLEEYRPPGPQSIRINW